MESLFPIKSIKNRCMQSKCGVVAFNHKEWLVFSFPTNTRIDAIHLFDTNNQSPMAIRMNSLF